jgi:uncharacterized membrane protein YidH (DUF202 family)
VSTTTTKPEATELAVERTWLAYERTLMAWVRTATSMISVGFSIYKFFQFEKEEGARRVPGFFYPARFLNIPCEHCVGLAVGGCHRAPEVSQATHTISFSDSLFTSRVSGCIGFRLRAGGTDCRDLACLRLFVEIGRAHSEANKIYKRHPD